MFVAMVTRVDTTRQSGKVWKEETKPFFKWAFTSTLNSIADLFSNQDLNPYVSMLRKVTNKDKKTTFIKQKYLNTFLSE